MKQAPTIGEYIKATSNAFALVFAPRAARSSEDFKPDPRFPSESNRAWEDTFVMWDSEEDRPTVRAELTA